jgi:hypothetical protein
MSDLTEVERLARILCGKQYDNLVASRKRYWHNKAKLVIDFAEARATQAEQALRRAARHDVEKLFEDLRMRSDPRSNFAYPTEKEVEERVDKIVNGWLNSVPEKEGE